MKTLYEVMNVDLAQQFTKERKREIAEELGLKKNLKLEVNKAIDSMDIPDDDDRHHWIQLIGRQSGADLLTIGKVQPENMIAMASLGDKDFQEAVKVATSCARSWNDLTVAAEKELNETEIPSTVL